MRRNLSSYLNPLPPLLLHCVIAPPLLCGDSLAGDIECWLGWRNQAPKTVGKGFEAAGWKWPLRISSGLITPISSLAEGKPSLVKNPGETQAKPTGFCWEKRLPRPGCEKGHYSIEPPFPNDIRFGVRRPDLYSCK